MSTDSKQIPTVTLTTLRQTGDANYVRPKSEKGSEHNLLSIVTDHTGTSEAVVAANQPSAFVVNSGDTTQRYPFVRKTAASLYNADGTLNQTYPVDTTPGLQQAPIVSAVESTDGATVSLGYEQTVIFNEEDACGSEPWQAVPTPVHTVVLEQGTNTPLGTLTFPPVAPGQIGIGKGHRVVTQEETTYTIDTLVTMPQSALQDGSSDGLQATSLTTVNVMDEALLSGNRTLSDAPQLTLENFGAVTQIAVLPRNDGKWDLAVMGYAEGNTQSQILVIKDVLSQTGVIDANQDNPAVSVINFEKHPNDDSNPDNRIVQVHLNGRRYLALATQNQFYCDQKLPL